FNHTKNLLSLLCLSDSHDSRKEGFRYPFRIYPRAPAFSPLLSFKSLTCTASKSLIDLGSSNPTSTISHKFSEISKVLIFILQNSLFSLETIEAE
ncbi:unnamed protein product, partial [Dovyalis caffra]